jgi:hypothetical protein
MIVEKSSLRSEALNERNGLVTKLTQGPGKEQQGFASYDVGGAKVRIAILYSILRACIGSMLAARRAGMKPARAAKAESTKTASISVTGS